MTRTRSFSRADAEVYSRTRVYDGFFSVDALELRHRLFEGGWSSPLRREVFVRPPAVGVLLVDPQRRELVLVEQFRVGAMAAEGKNSPWLLELVAGMVEAGESPEDVAIREAREEADCAIRELTPIHDYFSSPGGSNEWIHVYCASIDASEVGGVHGCDDENEDIRVVRLSLDQAREAMRQGRLHNAMTLIAVQWLLLNSDLIFP